MIGDDAVGQAVKVGTGGSRTVTVGSLTAGTTVSVKANTVVSTFGTGGLAVKDANDYQLVTASGTAAGSSDILSMRAHEFLLFDGTTTAATMPVASNPGIRDTSLVLKVSADTGTALMDSAVAITSYGLTAALGSTGSTGSTCVDRFLTVCASAAGACPAGCGGSSGACTGTANCAMASPYGSAECLAVANTGATATTGAACTFTPVGGVSITSNTGDIDVAASSTGTCAVTAAGTNGHCAAQTTSATCRTASTAGGITGAANACVFTAGANPVSNVLVSAGNLGINQATPTYALHIGAAGDSSGAMANSWNTFSDARLKTNVSSIEFDTLGALQKLRPVTFDWRNTLRHDLGFIAQELQQVFPLLVHKAPDGLLSVDYPRLNVYITRALQEETASRREAESSLRRELAELRADIAKMQELLKKGA